MIFEPDICIELLKFRKIYFFGQFDLAMTTIDKNTVIDSVMYLFSQCRFHVVKRILTVYYNLNNCMLTNVKKN